MGRYLDLARDANKAISGDCDQSDKSDQRGVRSLMSLMSQPAETIPEAWVEGVARLHPARPPGDVPLFRWRRIVIDMVGFITGEFAASAAAFGWFDIDLFGCDAGAPYARLDRAGLLWLVAPGRLIAITENTGTVEFPTGSRQTWHRRDRGFARVLPWDLCSG